MDKIEELIRMVYKSWKLSSRKIEGEHPDEEALACFFEDKLPQGESDRIKEHLVSCDYCAHAFVLNLKMKTQEAKEVPEELLSRVKSLLICDDMPSVLEIALKFKEKLLELINTTGDVLVGQELMPAPILRSHRIKDFKDEVTILKDLKDIRVEVKIENKGGKFFNLIIIAKQKQTQNIIKDLRVTLLKEDLELESYLTESGSVTFEHVLLGKYKVEISTLEDKLASVSLDIRT